MRTLSLHCIVNRVRQICVPRQETSVDEPWSIFKDAFSSSVPAHAQKKAVMNLVDLAQLEAPPRPRSDLLPDDSQTQQQLASSPCLVAGASGSVKGIRSVKIERGALLRRPRRIFCLRRLWQRLLDHLLSLFFFFFLVSKNKFWMYFILDMIH